MPVGLSAPDSLAAVPGFRLATVKAGIRYQDRLDLVLIEMAQGGTAAGVFTKNTFCAAPVHICRDHLARSAPRFLLINSGNANAGTGDQGHQDALKTCAMVAQANGVESSQVLPFSTGVIGENLNMVAFEKAIPAASESLQEDGWLQAAQGIMTTDTLAKGVSRRLDLKQGSVNLTGIAKGSGMIRPDMATMLAYVACDAVVSPERLQHCLNEAVETSFNSITVDGDTSTNDSLMLMASGASGVKIGDDELPLFLTALREVCETLAQAVIRDGEGASKFITIQVTGAEDRREARRVAYTVAHSPLVKTAFFASDPNWGRILAAVGRARVKHLDLNALRILLDDVCIVSHGGRDADYTEEAGQAVMNRAEITVTIELNRGASQARIWTTDLSHDYVTINADYRS